MSGLIRREDVGDVAVLSLCRPPTNAADVELIEELGEAIDRVAGDASRAVLIRSDVERFFMAGADIRAMLAALDAGDRATIERMGVLPAILGRLAALPKPTVAAINGVAAGGGLELALACDLRIAGASSRLGLPEVRIGLIPGAGGTQRLTRLLGPARALDLMLDGRLLLADEAERLGIVTRAVPDADVDTEAMALAQRLAAASPVAVAAIKRAVAAVAEGDSARGLAIEGEGIDAALWSDEGKAGLRAFLESRRSR
jgi:enoyl-CoA hydratase/carnithine racemase